MHEALQAYLEIRTANQTGLTVEQVRTINRCEAEHQRAYEAACRSAQRLGPVEPSGVEEFKVEMDERLKLPRVTFFSTEYGWMCDEIVVHKDGRLDGTL